MPVPRRFDRQPPERDQTRINERIRVPEVRLIDETGQQVGIMKTQDALRRAQERDLDLVEVAADAKPPVCRILDYSKYKYEQVQKQKAARKHQTQINVREIKFRPKIAQHDYDTKKGHVTRFLKGRDKVKVTIMFRGREMAHPERGEMILNRLAEDLGEMAVVEQRPQQDGRNMTMMLGPGKTVTDVEEVPKPAKRDRDGREADSEPREERAARPAPEPEAAAPEPEPEAVAPEPEPEPEAVAPEPEPEAAAPEPEAVAPEPEPEPEPEPVAKKPAAKKKAAAKKKPAAAKASAKTSS
jgi:translation initiation factor IF-3